MSQRQPLASIRRPIAVTRSSSVEPACGYYYFGDWYAEA